MTGDAKGYNQSSDTVPCRTVRGHPPDEVAMHARICMFKHASAPQSSDTPFPSDAVSATGPFRGCGAVVCTSGSLPGQDPQACRLIAGFGE